MDEFSPGKILCGEKSSNGVKKSHRNSLLRAEVKLKLLKIRKRLHREKAKEKQDNDSGVILPIVFEDLNKPQDNATAKRKSRLAKVVCKLWNMKKCPHLYSDKKFVYAGRVPCFLRRNIKRVNRRKIRRKRRKLLSLPNRTPKKQTGTKQFYFWFKHKNHKRSASAEIDRSQSTKRLCLEAEYRNTHEQSGAKTDRPNHDDSNSISSKTVVFDSHGNFDEVPKTEERLNEISHSIKERFLKRRVSRDVCFIKRDSSKTRLSDSHGNFDEVPKTEETLNEISHSIKERFPKRRVSRTVSFIERDRPKTRLSDTHGNFDKVPQSEETLTGILKNQKESSPKRRVSGGVSFIDRNRPRTWSASKVSRGTTKNEQNLSSDLKVSQPVWKPASGKDECFDISGRKIDANNVANSTQASLQPFSIKEKSGMPPKISAMDYFANELQARQSLSGGSIQTTSTPKPITVYSKSPRVRKSYITPPESDVSCTVEVEEYPGFDQVKHSEKEVSLTKTTRSTAETRIIYKPLFSSKPARLWKSVVIEQDS